MADFFDGQNIVKSYHTPDGINNGWLPISGSEAVPVPECDSRYWKIDDGSIVEMTDDEKLVVDTPPVILKTAKQIYSDIFDTFGVERVISDLKPVMTTFFDTCLRQESFNGFTMAKLAIDGTELSDDDKQTIKNIIDGTQ